MHCTTYEIVHNSNALGVTLAKFPASIDIQIYSMAGGNGTKRQRLCAQYSTDFQKG